MVVGVKEEKVMVVWVEKEKWWFGFKKRERENIVEVGKKGEVRVGDGVKKEITPFSNP